MDVLDRIPKQRILDALWPGRGLRADAGRQTVPCPWREHGCEHTHGDEEARGGTPTGWVNTRTGSHGCNRAGREGKTWRDLCHSVAPGWWEQLMGQGSGGGPARAARRKAGPEDFAALWAALEPEQELTARYAIRQDLRERYLRAGCRYPGDPRSDTAYGLWDGPVLRGAKFRLPAGAVWGVGVNKGSKEKLLAWSGSQIKGVLLRGEALDDEHPCDATIVLCAGEKDCLVAASHLDPERWAPVTGCVGEGYVVAPLHARARRRRVVIAYDADGAGAAGAAKNARALLAAGAAEVRIARVPEAVVAAGGKDVADVWQQLGSAGLVAMLEAAEPWSGEGEGGVGEPRDDDRPSSDLLRNDRPEIVITTDTRDQVDEVEELLARAEDLSAYQRGGLLVRVARPDAGPTIVPYPEATLAADLTALARWLRWDARADANVPALPPQPVVRALLARTEWRHVRPLDAIVRGPLLRPDGTAISTPGYDPEARVIYEPCRDYPPVPSHPTREQARAALDALIDVVDQFPWVSGGDRSAWLALVLTLVGRPAIAGALPMWVVRAATPGSGKTLLADLAALIGTDDEVPARMTQVGRDDDAEERKEILSVGLEGRSLALIDNVRRPLGSAQLEAVLTSPGGRYSGRLLGHSKMITVRAPLLVATGNNVQLRGDMPRRVLLVDLDPRCEHPEQRTGWRYPRVAEHVAAHRAELRAAALCVLCWYCAEGRPPAPVDLAAWGSYEEWSGLVRQALVWLGEPDPCGTAERVRAEADPEADARREALALWWQQWPEASLTALDVAAGASAELVVALAGCGARTRGEQLDPRGLGYALRALRGRIMGGLVLESLGSGGSQHVTRWRVVRSAGGDGGRGEKARSGEEQGGSWADEPAGDAGADAWGPGRE